MLLLIAVAVAGAGLARAVLAERSPTQREQVDAVAATIRCPTCQGLSIKDSPSVLAAGALQIVEEQVAQGRTPEQIRQYFVDRYGTYILLSPDPAGPGLLVWLLPAVLLPVAAGYGWWRLRRPVSAGTAAAAPSMEDDGDAVAALGAFASGALDPDCSPAGEALREALQVRLAAAADDLGDETIARTELRLGAAYRRYTRRTPARTRPARVLPRRAVTTAAVVALLLCAGSALAVGLRTRGPTDLPTGDLPGQAAAPGLAELVAATRDRPEDPSGWVALGRAYEAAGALTLAVQAYDRALALRPGADDVMLLRATLLVRAGSPSEAMPALTGLAARHPDDPDTILLLGLAQNKLGRPEAADTLRRFLALAPESRAAAMVRDLLAGR